MTITEQTAIVLIERIDDIESRLAYFPDGPDKEQMYQALEELRRSTIRRLVEMDLGE